MKKIVFFGFSCFMVFSPLRASNNPKITIKIGIYYTAAANSAITPLTVSDAEKRIAKVQDVLENIAPNMYQAKLMSFAQIDYKEPKHRSDDYAIDRYDGMRQVFGELVDQVSAYTYFADLNQTGVFGMMDASEVDNQYALTDLMVRSDINIFIVEEEGLDSYYFVQNPLDPLNDGVGAYNGGDFDGLLPAVINTREYQVNDMSIALAVFGLLADPNDATPIDEESTEGSLLSFFSYYYDPTTFDVASELSTQNICTFRHSLKKMKMDSPDVIDIEGKIRGNNKRIKIDANEYVRMQSSTDITSVVLAPTGPTDYVTISTDSFTTDFTEPVTCNLTNSRPTTMVNSPQEVSSVVIPVVTKSTLSVYPNPFTNEFNMRFDASGQATAMLYIFDLQGREMERQSFDLEPRASTHTIQFDATDFNMGMYIYRLKVGEKLFSGTIIKEYNR